MADCIQNLRRSRTRSARSWHGSTMVRRANLYRQRLSKEWRRSLAAGHKFTIFHPRPTAQRLIRPLGGFRQILSSNHSANFARFMTGDARHTSVSSPVIHSAMGCNVGAPLNASTVCSPGIPLVATPDRAISPTMRVPVQACCIPRHRSHQQMAITNTVQVTTA